MEKDRLRENLWKGFGEHLASSLAPFSTLAFPSLRNSSYIERQGGKQMLPFPPPPILHWLSFSIPTAQQSGSFLTCCCPACLPLPGPQLFPDSWTAVRLCLRLNCQDLLLACLDGPKAHPQPCLSNVPDPWSWRPTTAVGHLHLCKKQQLPFLPGSSRAKVPLPPVSLRVRCLPPIPHISLDFSGFGEDGALSSAGGCLHTTH